MVTICVVILIFLLLVFSVFVLFLFFSLRFLQCYWPHVYSLSCSFWSIICGPTHHSHSNSSTRVLSLLVSDRLVSCNFSLFPIVLNFCVHSCLLQAHPTTSSSFSLCTTVFHCIFVFGITTQYLPTVPTSRRTRRNCKRSMNKKCASTSSSTCAHPSPSCPTRQQPTKWSTPPPQGCQK